MGNEGEIACVVVFFFLILLMVGGAGWSNYRTYNQCKRSFRQKMSCAACKIKCKNKTGCIEYSCSEECNWLHMFVKGVYKIIIKIKKMLKVHNTKLKQLK